jgi:hypothetical protein
MNYHYIYISFIISTIFFIYKQIINKQNPSKDANFNKNTIREIFFIFIISFVTLYLHNLYLKKQDVKTEIFTSQPSF